jgi:ribonuclease BN (tRNA processing enzyme)
VSDGRSAIAYLCDHGPSELGPGPDGWGPYHDAALSLAEGVDLLIHDAQHTAEELPAVRHFGHSAAEYAVRLGEVAGAKAVLLSHHDPNRTDDEVDAIVARFSDRSISVTGASEGVTIDL